MELHQESDKAVEDQKEGASGLQLFLLFSAVFIDLMGFGIIIPILPLLNERLGGDALDYGLIIAIYSFMQFVFSPIWGSISDRVGRKPIILIGLGGSAIGFGLFGYATELWMLYFARAVAGIFTAATLTTANAYIADVTTPEERGGAFSLISAAFGLGFAVGPGVGGLLSGYTGLNYILDDFVPRLGTHVLPSFAATGLALLSMVGAFFFLPESLKEKLTERVEGRSKIPMLDTLNYKDHENTLLYVFVFAFVAFGLSGFIAAFPQFALVIDESVDETALGLYFTFVGVILFVTQTFFIRPLISTFGEAVLVRTGLLFVTIGFFTVSFAPNFIWTFLPNGFFTLGIAFLLPTMNSLISNSVSAENQGNIMGISQGWSAFMRILGPIFAGYLFGFGIRIPFYLSGSVYVILFLISLRRINESPGKVR